MRVLFVCMGNICRSPTAEVVLRDLLQREAPELDIEVDSAGTHDFHCGQPPDHRACAAARRRGLDMGMLRARQLSAADFRHFDLVLVMDRENHRDALALAPSGYRDRVKLLLDYAPAQPYREVPDPYHGDEASFETALDLIEAGAQGLLAELRSR